MIRSSELALLGGSMDLFGASVVFLFAVSILLIDWSSAMKRQTEILFFLMIAGCVMQVADGSCYLLMSQPESAVYMASMNLTYLAFYYFLFVCFTYVYEFISAREPVSRAILYVQAVFCAAAALFWMISTYSGKILNYRDGFYERGPLYWVGQMSGLSTVFLCLGMLIRHRKALGKREFWIFITYLLMPTLSSVLHYIVPEIMLLFPSITIMLALIFIGISVQNEKDLRRNAEAEKLKLFVNRVQPGILLDSLSDIQAALYEDPESAREAVDAFSSYLRENIDALAEESFVPVSNELDHLQDYIYLAEMHYGSRLAIRLEGGGQSFRLPRTILQFLLQDVVKFTMDAGSGQEHVLICVKTGEKEDAYLVEITWRTGGALSPAKKNAKERSILEQEAFSNIPELRKRLMKLEGAALDVTDTSVVVSIAK